jgi:hypothetical protein
MEPWDKFLREIECIGRKVVTGSSGSTGSTRENGSSLRALDRKRGKYGIKTQIDTRSHAHNH